MKTILDNIVKKTRERIEIKKRQNASENNFIHALKTPQFGDIAIIAEIKLKSPIAGVLDDKKNITKRAMRYESGRADAISIVTEPMFFNGHTKYISRVKKTVSIPLLQKDFIIDPYQLYESKKNNADAVLLIARILPRNILSHFVDICFDLGMEPVVEAYDDKDLDKAVNTKTRIIGVNARNLVDFSIDIDHACALIKKIPKGIISCGFSGVTTRADIEKYKEAGARAVLVGTSMMKTNNVKKYISQLKNI